MTTYLTTLLLVSASTNAFTIVPSHHGVASNTLAATSTSTSLSSASSPDGECARREWVRSVATSIGGGGVVLSSLSVASSPASAAVYLDPDRYGDKELKIATVNKIRQNVRNAVVSDPSLAPLFLRLALQDALTYDASTDEGGPDGSVVRAVLEDKSNDSGVVALRPAAEKLIDIAKSVKRTTEITMADVVTFAGAEAIESAGGPRVAVQLGKTDPRGNSAPSKKQRLPDLFGPSSDAAGVVGTFQKAGLTEREAALLYGAVGSMERVAAAAAGSVVEEDEEPNEMGDVEVFVPSSFGAPQDIYGRRIGVMDNAAFTAIVADAKKGKKPTTGVFADDKVMQWAVKYAGNKGGFLKDLPEAYTKTMAVGSRYTGGKVGSLLEQNDSI